MTTSSTGVFDLNDFLPSYLYALRQQLHDAQATFFQDTDLIPWINEARRHVCVDTGCLRTLQTVTFPANQESFAFGGVYAFNKSVATPSGVPPFKLVSGGGGTATADTSTVPMTVSISDSGDAAGYYYQPPIITFDYPGMNISATAVAQIDETGELVSATLYGTQDARPSPYTTANTIHTNHNDDPDGATGFTSAATPNTYGELLSQGGGSTWPDDGSIPDPSGYGFLWNSTALEDSTLQPTTWKPTLTVKLTGTGSLSADFVFYFRVYKLSSLGVYTQIVAAESGSIVVTGSAATVTSWTNNTSDAVDFTVGDKLYVDVIGFVPPTTIGGMPSHIAYDGTLSTGSFSYQPNVGGLTAINVTSDAGEYNAASVTPMVNIVPVGTPATVQDDGTGNLEIVTQGSGQDVGCVIEDSTGAFYTFDVSSLDILPKLIASVDNCTLIWNSQRMALRNMAFSDFSALLRAWVPYTNIPVAFSVYRESIYIGPIPNQAYPYELDCIMYPDYLPDYLTVGQISNRACISAVKYYAAYLAKMSQDETEQAADFLNLYQKEIAWASNLYTTRLVRPYNDNAELD